jgi:hypothetical protein
MKFQTNFLISFVFAIVLLLTWHICSCIETQDFDESYENKISKLDLEDSDEDINKDLQEPITMETLYKIAREINMNKDYGSYNALNKRDSKDDKKNFRRQLARWDIGFGKRETFRRQLARWDIGFGKRAFRTKSYMDALYGKRSDY